MKLFSGRVALVTGCGSADGIGMAIAKDLAAAGAHVAITSTTERIFDRANELGAPHCGFVADLSSPEQTRELLAEVTARFGKIDIVVNNAGMVQQGVDISRSRIEELPESDWNHHLAITLGTCFHVIRAVLPQMQAQGYGRIVNICSVTGPLVTIAESSGYATAKAGMTGLTRTVAIENAAMGITCNAVLPGWIATASSSPSEIRAGEACPTARPGTPQEVAACCTFLASDGASYVNGAMLVVDGGNTIVEMKGA